MNYKLMTDSGSDLTYEYVKKHNVEMVALKYFIGEEEFLGYRETKSDAWIREVYTRLRNKDHITTSCVNSEEFENTFSKYAEVGTDIFYLAFSSALSATYDVAQAAAKKVREKYPNVKICVVDSRAASYGQGMFFDLCRQKADEGMEIDELEQWALENRDHICHWFTVEDLFFLKRGGRVSAATAIAGTVLGIKPVMHVDDEGRLIKVTTARGRRASLDALADQIAQTAIDIEHQKVWITHGDSQKDAKYLESRIKERYGVKDFEVSFVSPMIGAHSGPGTIALFFFGTKK